MDPTFADLRASNRRREGRLLGLALAFVFLGAAALSLAPAAQSAEFSDVRWRSAHWAILPLWALSAWLVRRTLDRVRPQRDPLLLPTAFLLTGWGLLLVWRLSPAFGLRQLAWFVVASGGLILLLRRGGSLLWLRRYRYLWLGGGMLLTALTLLLGTNPSSRDPPVVATTIETTILVHLHPPIGLISAVPRSTWTSRSARCSADA